MSAQEAWGLAETPLEGLENVEEDPAWTKWLPEGSKIIGTEGSGASSFWSRTARIDTRLPNGDLKSYFFKLMNDHKGFLMARGEYASMLALYNVAPHCIPRPIGWGTFQNDPRNHFFLCDFLDLADEIPDPVSVCKALADLHLQSISQSKNGLYGFEVPSCNGTFAQDNTWNVSWEAFFVQQMEGAFKADEDVHGRSEEYDRLRPAFYDRVIPRLLRPLETGGNSIKPCLVHGDLWDGNVSFRIDADEPYFYDASSFWGHNEYDLHNWRGARFRLSKTFIKEYFNHFPISSPQEDWDDRNMLYAIRADLHSSILHRTTTGFRNLVIDAMRQLIEKFPNGYEGNELRRDVQLAEAAAANDKQSVPSNGILMDASSVPEAVPGDLKHTSSFGLHGTSDKDERNGGIWKSVPPNAVNNTSEIRVRESAISPAGTSIVGSHS